MHFANADRMARLCGKLLGEIAIPHSRLIRGRLNFSRLNFGRLVIGVALLSSAFLLNTHTLYAQGVDPERVPLMVQPSVDLSPESGSAESVPLEVPFGEESSVASTPSDLIHVIAVGDTLTNVAQRYNVEIANLAAYNQVNDYNHVFIGQKLRIPPAGVTITAPAVTTLPGAEGYHVVRVGESMSGIARLYGLTLDELMALNEIDEPNHILLGTMLRLTADVEPANSATLPELNVVTYRVERGDTLSEIAQAYYTTVDQLVADNKLSDAEVMVGQELKIYPPSDAFSAFGVGAPEDGERQIVIDLSDQTLTAYQGGVVVLHSYVSTGKAATPTRVGEFAIYQKLDSQTMTGEDYELPGVPWVMYYDGEMAMHGAYWHANFGIPTSHGCTNMTIPDARALYTWAPVGTKVTVQW
jgi:LysM repeat protein